MRRQLTFLTTTNEELAVLCKQSALRTAPKLPSMAKLKITYPLLIGSTSLLVNIFRKLSITYKLFGVILTFLQGILDKVS